MTDRTNTPPMHEILQSFRGANYITSLDLSKVCLQIRMAKSSRQYAAFQFENKVQGEHKVFPRLQTFITRKHVGTLHCTSVRRVSAVDNFPTRRCTSTLWFTCSSVFGCKISKQVDRERWSDTLATTIAGYHSP
jgi:hypothetical protein